MLQRIYPPKQKMYYPKSNTEKGQRQKVIKAGEHLKTMVEVGASSSVVRIQKVTPCTYREYDVNPFQKGVNRGAERIVRDNDGRSYYTSDHYTTFTRIE